MDQSEQSQAPASFPSSTDELVQSLSPKAQHAYGAQLAGKGVMFMGVVGVLQQYMSSSSIFPVVATGGALVSLGMGYVFNRNAPRGVHNLMILLDKTEELMAEEPSPTPQGKGFKAGLALSVVAIAATCGLNKLADSFLPSATRSDVTLTAPDCNALEVQAAVRQIEGAGKRASCVAR
jgi:hypothetical protein